MKVFYEGEHMGRTVVTYRIFFEQIARKWELFRKTLQSKDREAFDEMLRKARLHSSAASFDIQPDPTESMFLSILLEHEKDITELKGKMEIVSETEKNVRDISKCGDTVDTFIVCKTTNKSSTQETEILPNAYKE